MSVNAFDFFRISIGFASDKLAMDKASSICKIFLVSMRLIFTCGISRKTPQPVIAFETTRSVFAMLFFTVRGGHNVHGEVFLD